MADAFLVPSTRGAQVIAWSYVTWSIAAIFTFLRLLVRVRVVRVIGKEDACIALALVGSLLVSVFMHLQVVKGGLGQHFDTLSPANLRSFFEMSYFSILFYNLSLCLTKFAICFLCLRVFGPSNWRKACLAVLAFLCLLTLWLFIVGVIPCIPVRRYWDKSVDGWCFPNPVLWFLNAALNIFSDFLVVLLPIPGIFKLQLPRKQKIGVSLVFALGFFICIISLVRLHALYVGATTVDPTYDNHEIAIWSVVEVNGAIIGACLPTLKPLISRIWPNLLSSGRSRPDASYGVGANTIGSRRERTIPGVGRSRAEPDFHWNATEILGTDDVALSHLGDKSSKRAGVHEETIALDDDAISRNDTVTITERQTSSDGWSGRSSQRPVYEIKDDIAKAC